MVVNFFQKNGDESHGKNFIRTNHLKVFLTVGKFIFHRGRCVVIVDVEEVIVDVRTVEWCGFVLRWGVWVKLGEWVSRWWFQTFFIFTPIWGNDPI